MNSSLPEAVRSLCRLLQRLLLQTTSKPDGLGQLQKNKDSLLYLQNYYCHCDMMERLRATRLSPIPASASNAVFPTVLEEPVTPSGSEEKDFVTVGESPTENGHVFRKHRRRLPLVQPLGSKNSRSSRSFDSGISCLLSSESGSPGPNSTEVPGSPNHISSRQSYMSSPANSPGPPRSPRTLPGRNPLSPRPYHHPAFFGQNFSTNRRYSEQTESYANSTKSSEDSDSSPPCETSPPPNGTMSPPPTSPKCRVSRRMLPETPKTPSSVWEQSRDSLDSGVYSRSTTCDSYPGRSSGSPILSSTSPPTLARHSWRSSRGVARLPEPPVIHSGYLLGSCRVITSFLFRYSVLFLEFYVYDNIIFGKIPILFFVENLVLLRKLHQKSPLNESISKIRPTAQAVAPSIPMLGRQTLRTILLTEWDFLPVCGILAPTS